jgi:hypothetical protein
MAPGSLGSRIGLGATRPTLRTKQRPTSMTKSDLNLSTDQVQINVFNSPRIVQAKKGTVMLVENIHLSRIQNPQQISDQPLNSRENQKSICKKRSRPPVR